MTFNQLLSFVNVVESGSFLKAAETMFISSQALNQQINNLEEELGCKLLVRSTRGVALTSAGSCFYDGSKEILTMQTELVAGTKKASEEQDNTIRIGFSHSLGPGLVQLVTEEYSRSFPKSEVIMSPMRLNYLLKSIAEDDLDICELGYRPDLIKKDIRFLYLRDFGSKWICVMSPFHKLASRSQIHPLDLDGYRVIVPERCWYQPLHKFVSNYLPSQSIEYIDTDCPYEDSEIASVSNPCLNDHTCISILPIWAGRSLPYLISVPFDFHMKMDYGLAYRANPKPAVKDFLQVAEEMAACGALANL